MRPGVGTGYFTMTKHGFLHLGVVEFLDLAIPSFASVRADAMILVRLGIPGGGTMANHASSFLPSGENVVGKMVSTHTIRNEGSVGGFVVLSGGDNVVGLILTKGTFIFQREYLLR